MVSPYIRQLMKEEYDAKQADKSQTGDNDNGVVTDNISDKALCNGDNNNLLLTSDGYPEKNYSNDSVDERTDSDSKAQVSVGAEKQTVNDEKTDLSQVQKSNGKKEKKISREERIGKKSHLYD